MAGDSGRLGERDFWLASSGSMLIVATIGVNALYMGRVRWCPARAQKTTTQPCKPGNSDGEPDTRAFQTPHISRLGAFAGGLFRPWKKDCGRKTGSKAIGPIPLATAAVGLRRTP